MPDLSREMLSSIDKRDNGTGLFEIVGACSVDNTFEIVDVGGPNVIEEEAVVVAVLE